MPDSLTVLPTLPGESLPVGPSWPNHPVGFALLTEAGRQWAAYYDGEGHLVVAARALDSRDWIHVRLGERVGWDSHNYVTMAADTSGCLHLSGNMHGDPLVYFRTRLPFDIGTFERVPAMTGDRELRVTYPQFFKGPGGELCYSYRDGSSGKGDQVYNRYSVADGIWERLSDGPLVIGEGIRNAYLNGPRRGADGVYHMCWVWRDAPEAWTNHHVCYARSADLVRWETSTGAALELPIRFGTCEIVDPVPAGQGLMNGNIALGFAPDSSPILSYNKLDARGNSQLFNARPAGGKWEIVQASEWEGAWLPRGLGSIRYNIRVHPVVADPHGGGLTQRYWHHEYGHGKWQIDAASLRPSAQLAATSAAFESWNEPGAPGLRVNWSRERGSGTDTGPASALRWETLPENGDRKRDGLAEPGELRVVRLGLEDA